jgi:hypothetical protein
MIVAGESSYLLDIATALSANGVLLAIVAPDRVLVERAVRIAEDQDGVVFGITADPSNRTVWKRIAPHIEQRLGPIDVAVVVATAPTRRVISTTLLPDMTARGRGVLIEAGAKVPTRKTAAGVRHRSIQGAFAAGELAAAVLLCASDTMVASSLVMTARQTPA